MPLSNFATKLSPVLLAVILQLILVAASPNQVLAQGQVTGSTTWTNHVEVMNSDAVPLSDLIGNRRLAFSGITLDGTTNSVEIQAPFVDSVMNLDTTAGSLTADLTIVQISVNSEGDGQRHFVAIQGGWRDTSIRLELDFEPGMGAITGTVATPEPAPVPYHLKIAAADGRTWNFDGVAGAAQETPDTEGETGSQSTGETTPTPPSVWGPADQTQAAALHGQVRGPSDSPMSGAKIFVTSDDLSTLFGSAVSMTLPSVGHYQILGLPVGVPLRLFAFHDAVPGVLYSMDLTLGVNEFKRQDINLDIQFRDPGMIGNPLDRLITLLGQNRLQQWGDSLRQVLKNLAHEEALRTGNAHVLLMLDSSGSMHDSDPQDVRKSVARFLVDRLPAQAAVGVLDFDDDAQILTPVQTGDASRRGAMNAIDRIDAEGSTDLGAALRGGLAQFQSTTPAAKRAAVLLTDGKGDYQGEAETYARMDIKLYTVGLGSQCDEALLSAMADQTGGAYFKADDAGRLFQSFEAAIVDINDEQTFYTEQGTIVPQEHRFVTFNVEVGLDQFMGMVTWPGSDLDLQLIGPDGQVVTGGRTAADRYEMVHIDHPQPGPWRAEITAVDVAPGGEPFTFSASAVSDLRLETPGWNSLAEAGPGPLAFQVVGGSVGGLKGRLEVESPTGKSQTVTMRAGANPGELIAGRDWLNEPGDYQLQAVVEGRYQGATFRRELHRTLHVQSKGPLSVTERLINDLWARDVMVRIKAVKELGKQKCQAAQPFLKELLSDPSAQVRQEAAWALARIHADTP